MNLFNKNFKKFSEKKLTIKGETKNFDTYKIPLDLLWFNDKNGRIASFLQEYNDSTNKIPLSELKTADINKYNDIIAEQIKKSANDGGVSFQKTKENIRTSTQKTAGVVLSDGRIIDGNRRFTALRELYKETGQSSFFYFEAAIIQAPESESDIQEWKQIKALELELQFNTDEKRNYDKIDRLVDFYNDVMKNNIFTEIEYCYTTGITSAEFKKNKRIVEVMLDYLKWRGSPNKFYILKDKKLDGPLEEIANRVNKMDDVEWQEKKDTLYIYLSTANQGSRTPITRKIMDSAIKNRPLFHSFNNMIKKKDVSDRLDELLNLENKKNKNLTPNDSQKKKKLQFQLSEYVDKAYTFAKREDDLSGSSEKDKIQTIYKDLLNICESSTFGTWTQTQKDKFIKTLKEIKECINEIETKLE